MQSRIDTLVLGAGMRGLVAALRAMRQSPAGTLLVVDAAPRPGGSLRTQRSNGFSCELGPFAFAPEAIAEPLALLASPPRTIAAAVTTGQVFTANGLVATTVDPVPVSFASGAEELAQAIRRELGNRLLLGRAATVVSPQENGFRVTLGGESPTTLEASRLVLALPLRETAGLLGAFDHALPGVADRLRAEPRAFVFLGGDASAMRERTGYGIVAADDVASPLREAIHCDLVFPGRALPGRGLVRCEIGDAGLAADDEATTKTATNELRAWTGTRAAFPFTKVHRFHDDLHDGAAAECRVRLHAIAAAVSDLILT